MTHFLRFVIIILVIMFSFLTKTHAKYEKVFFDFQIKSINGELIDLSKYRNKAILIVNVASRCGFTKQYEDLEILWKKYKDQGLIVMGFPSNQFGNQEPGNNKEIKKFCETNFGITFPIMAKTNILGDTGHPFYRWVEENYGKSGVPKWNFYKVLINKSGKIEDVYNSITNPSSKKIKNRINSILQ